MLVVALCALLVAVAARLRWRCENEGFNVLKNGGFALEHVYSRKPTASKAYVFLMLIAHTIQQLLPHHRRQLQRERLVFRRDRRLVRRFLKDALDGGGLAYAALVGENWMINSPQAPDLAEKLGGELITGE